MREKRHGERKKNIKKGETSGLKMESKLKERCFKGERERREILKKKNREKRVWKSLTQACQYGSTASRRKNAIPAVSLHYFSSFDSD